MEERLIYFKKINFLKIKTTAYIFKNIEIIERWIPDAKGRALEIIAEVETQKDLRSFSIDVLASENGEEKTSIMYDSDNKSFCKLQRNYIYKSISY